MAQCGTHASPYDPYLKHFTHPNHPVIVASQSAWNGMTTQQAVYIITAAMLIFAIGV